MNKRLKVRGRRFWREWAKPVLVMLLITCSIRSAIADWNDVPTGSMKPTIIEGDRVFVNKLAYDLKVPFTTWHVAEWGEPERGDIVVFFSPHDGMRLVKRVVGVPGDTIQLMGNRLFVNGEAAEYAPLAEDLVRDIPATQRGHHEFAKETVEERSHAVMVTPSLRSLNTFGPAIVPDGHYFMMGDNRDNSFDSRFYGPVAREKIVGRATAVALSFDRQHHFKPRWHRFFEGLE
ncbi:MAG: signal peptidase I [Verrucomicrobiota bacterium]